MPTLASGMPACCKACANGCGTRFAVSCAIAPGAHHNQRAINNRKAYISVCYRRLRHGYHCVPADLTTEILWYLDKERFICFYGANMVVVSRQEPIKIFSQTSGRK